MITNSIERLFGAIYENSRYGLLRGVCSPSHLAGVNKENVAPLLADPATYRLFNDVDCWLNRAMQF